MERLLLFLIGLGVIYIVLTGWVMLAARSDSNWQPVASNKDGTLLEWNETTGEYR